VGASLFAGSFFFASPGPASLLLLSASADPEEAFVADPLAAFLLSVMYQPLPLK
jgi:hypothetical protein